MKSLDTIEDREFDTEDNDIDMCFANPPKGRLIVKREGKSITRKIPKPVVLVDTREKSPYLFTYHTNWIQNTLHHKLDVGDYSIEGLEDEIVLERKTLTDIISTLMQHRKRFFKLCDKMSKFRWKAILIEATYEDIKSFYNDLNTSAHPNAVSGSLDALEAKFGIPIIYTSREPQLAEEKAASWLSKHFTYWYLENNGYGRLLQDGDL